MHVHTHMHTHRGTHTHVHVCSHMHAHTRSHTCTHARSHICTHACSHRDMHSHTHTHTHTQALSHKHTHSPPHSLFFPAVSWWRHRGRHDSFTDGKTEVQRDPPTRQPSTPRPTPPQSPLTHRGAPFAGKARLSRFARLTLRRKRDVVTAVTGAVVHARRPSGRPRHGLG